MSSSLFGYSSHHALLEDYKSVAEGFGADGKSFLYHHLIARGSQVKIPADDLARYDENIRRHLEKINRGRTEKITLRSFQHLAAHRNRPRPPVQCQGAVADRPERLCAPTQCGLSARRTAGRILHRR